MKLNILASLCLGALLGGGVLCSCDDKFEPVSSTEGTLNLADLGVDVSEIEKVMATGVSASKAPGLSRAEAAYDINSFTVRVLNSEGIPVNSWTYATTPEIITFAPGAYTLEVYNAELQPAAWDAPYFFADKRFNIVAGAIERIGTLTCKFSNIRVSVTFDDNILPLLGDDVQVTIQGADGEFLTFTKNETRSAYFQALDGSTTLGINFEGTVAGHMEKFSKSLSDVSAGQHRKIHISATGGSVPVQGETGYIDPTTGIGINFSVTDEDVDGNVEAEEEVIEANRPQEDPENPDDPSRPDDPVTPGDDSITFSSDHISFDSVNDPTVYGDPSEDPSLLPAAVLIESTAGFAHLYVQIVSESLNDEMLRGVGLSASFDLADGHAGTMNANGTWTVDAATDLSGALANDFGFPVGSDVVGKTSANFDITAFVPLLAIYPGELHQFVLTVVDAKGNKESRTLKFQ